MLTLNNAKPIKTLHDKRLSYLVGLEAFYKSEGYTTKLNGRDNILEVYEKGATIPKITEEVTLEKWAN